MIKKYALMLHALALLSLSNCWNSDKKNAPDSEQEDPSKKVTTASKDKYITQIASEQQFDELLKKTEKPIVIKVDAEWCDACKRIQRYVLEAAQKGADLLFARINIDQLPDLCKQYKVPGVPTLLFFKEGQEIADSRLVGPEVHSGDDLLTQIRQAISQKNTK